MIKNFLVINFITLFLCTQYSFAADSTKFYAEGEMSQAQTLGISTIKMEDFFKEDSKGRWMSMKNHTYQYNSQRQKSVDHQQAVIVKAVKQPGTFGCDILGTLAIFPNTDESIKKIYKSPLPDFNDFFGTPFNCYITFYGSTDHKFLVLDHIAAGFDQKGKGFSQVATDAFIKFAQEHTNAQFILCDPRNPIYRQISIKFGFKFDKENQLWSHFKKGVVQHYTLNLSEIRQ